MRWIFVQLQILLHVRDSLRTRQTYRMFVKSVACSLSELYVRQIQNTSIRDWMIRIFLINVYVFDFRWKSINTNSLFELRFMRNRIFVKRYSYEYIKNFILIKDNKIDWFFEFEMLETIYDEKILHCRMSKSNLIYIFILISLHQCDSRNRLIQIIFLKIFIQKTFATVSVQKWYSYEINVNDLNWLLFKITTSWLKTWNEIVRFQ